MSKPLQYYYDIALGLDSEQNGFADVCFLEQDATNSYKALTLGTGGGNAHQPQQESMQVDTPKVIKRINDANAFLDIAQNVQELKNTTMKFLLGPRTYEWDFVNFENHPVKLEIYIMKSRRDMRQPTAAYVAGSGVTPYEGQDLNDILARCLDRDGQITYGANCLRSIDPNWTPYQSPTFCQGFKVLKKKTLELNAGQCYRTKYVAKKPWVLTDFYASEYETYRTYAKNSILIMVKFIGCSVLDSATPTSSQYGRSRLAVHHKFRTTIWQLNTATQNCVKNHLSSPSGPVVPANAIYMSKPVAAQVAEN
jgi:hypothetical protein